VPLYSPGDIVFCKIGYGKVLLADDKEYEVVKDFSIVCICDSGYLIFLPNDVYLKNSFALSKHDCKEFSLAKKFLDSTVHYISDEHVVALRNRLTGLACMKCHEHFEYAEVNRLDQDGKGTLICWRCRSYPFYG
jgi:hypothetical protein